MRTKLLMILSLILCGVNVFADEHPVLNAFPPPEQGMNRFVITLPEQQRSEEERLMVELVAGQEMETDGVNLVRLSSKFEAFPLHGWGYTFYKVTGQPLTLSTMMAVPDGASKVKQWVKTAPLKIRYNSRLPVVIYAPDGYQLRYRIWKAPVEFSAVNPG